MILEAFECVLSALGTYGAFGRLGRLGSIIPGERIGAFSSLGRLGSIIPYLYILLRLVTGWFSSKFTSCYVYPWGGFRANLHSITSIRGMVLEWKKQPRE